MVAVVLLCGVLNCVAFLLQMLEVAFSTEVFLGGNIDRRPGCYWKVRVDEQTCLPLSQFDHTLEIL